MAQHRPPAGGICYHGTVDDSGSDWGTALQLIGTGSNNISIVWGSDRTLTMRYNWMDDDHWIFKFVPGTNNKVSYSVYTSQSGVGDVFVCLSGTGSDPGPVYNGDLSVYRNGSSHWDGDDTTGITGTATGICFAKLQSTDVTGGSESYTYIIGQQGNGDAIVLPDSISTGITGSNPPPTYAHDGCKFTTLGPVSSKWSAGVSTYTRFPYMMPSGGIGVGSSSIGGYKFQIVQLYQGSKDVVLAMKTPNT